MSRTTDFANLSPAEITDESPTSGTWTPTPIITWGSGTLTLNSSSGKYTKIGKVVVCAFSLNFNKSGSMNVGFSGLPFSADNEFNDGGAYGSARRTDAGGTHYMVETVSGTQVNVLRGYNNSSISDGNNIQMNGILVYQIA